jgi:hypothetical protein
MPSSPTVSSSVVQRHPSPPLGMVAIAFTVLFCAGLYPVTAFGGKPYFPGPWESAQTIVTFFHLRPTAVQLCAFLQFGSAVPLGVFTATIVSRLRFLGVKAAGAYIALFGGFGAAFAIASSAIVIWTMSHSGIVQDTAVTQALYFIGYGLGGPGYSVPLGLLMAGVSVPLLLYRLVPRWIPILGLALAVCGELSWLNLEFPATVLLIPLTRFPGFVWMIAVGFALPATTKRAAVVSTQANS